VGKSGATGFDPELHHYILENSLREPDVLAELRAETDTHPMSIMQIPPEQGQLLGLLVELTAAQKVVELGTFTGYSALAMAHYLPADGMVHTCDIDPEATAIAQRYWTKAGMDQKITLHLGPGTESLDHLLDAHGECSFDLAFIDADKPGYPEYYECCLRLLRTGGLICIDNVLMMGSVIEEEVTSENTLAMIDFNKRLKTDERVSLAMLSVADGLTLARKR